MKNPWLSLNFEETRIHEMDQTIVEEFNRKAKKEVQFCTQLLPDPYIGSLEADVLVLALNPGLSEEDYATHSDIKYRQLYKENLYQKVTEYPFYYLNPELDCPGSRWWNRKLRWLLEKVDRKQLAKSICCMQLMPYHSVRFKETKENLPTQEYTRFVVKQFMERNTPIVFMRSKKKWVELVPELEGYPYSFVMRNPRNPTFSPKNMGEENFEEVVEILGAGKL
ncbi:MAG: hypothetical protein ACEPOZ_20000 [Marinifilaceae bacterium]